MLFTTCSRLGLGWLSRPSGAFGVGADGIPFHFLIFFSVRNPISQLEPEKATRRFYNEQIRSRL